MGRSASGWGSLRVGGGWSSMSPNGPPHPSSSLPPYPHTLPHLPSPLPTLHTPSHLPFSPPPTLLISRRFTGYPPPTLHRPSTPYASQARHFVEDEREVHSLVSTLASLSSQLPPPEPSIPASVAGGDDGAASVFLGGEEGQLVSILGGNVYFREEQMVWMCGGWLVGRWWTGG